MTVLEEFVVERLSVVYGEAETSLTRWLITQGTDFLQTRSIEVRPWVG
jgi:hypothetical protein